MSASDYLKSSFGWIYESTDSEVSLFTIDIPPTYLFISRSQLLHLPSLLDLFAEDFCLFHLTFAYSIIARN